MMSRSHQGMLSPPVKKLPTDSKKRPIFASIDPGWSAESAGDPRRRRRRGGRALLVAFVSKDGGVGFGEEALDRCARHAVGIWDPRVFGAKEEENTTAADAWVPRRSGSNQRFQSLTRC